VRHFHGLASFYRKFIRIFNNICKPILETVKKKNRSFNWTTEDEKGYIILKEKITKQLVMVLPDFKKTFQVRCDASGVVIGAVCSQENNPIAYLSEKLN
jgi:hypothetical protein